jgi:hypothetical protein
VGAAVRKEKLRIGELDDTIGAVDVVAVGDGQPPPVPSRFFSPSVKPLVHLAAVPADGDSDEKSPGVLRLDADVHHAVVRLASR